jgi:hypothetical protein
VTARDYPRLRLVVDNGARRPALTARRVPLAPSQLAGHIVASAEALADEVDAARLTPDSTPAGRALLGLLDAVHDLRCHEANPRSLFTLPGTGGGPDAG